MTTVTITLAHAHDLDGFRRALRTLVAAGAPPQAVHWQVAGEAVTPDLFATDLGTPPPDTPAAPVALPRAYTLLAGHVVRHRSAERFALLYRLAWRLRHEPALRRDALDPDWLAAQRLAREVQRAAHQMKAFVRFRPLAAAVAAADGTAVEHVAWFEPAHRVLDAVAPFFARRFATLAWAIVTPDASVRWQPGGALRYGPGGHASEAPAADAGEALWLTYYAHIFNPARLKLATMQRQMPRAYWANLPEAALIDPLTAAARRLR